MAMYQRERGVRPVRPATCTRAVAVPWLLLLAALVTLTGAVESRTPSPGVVAGVTGGVAGGAGGAELAELAEREVAANSSASGLSPDNGGANRHTAGTIREALGGGVVEAEPGPVTAPAPPLRVRTGGSRCTEPQQCIRVDQCPPRDSGVLFECAAGRVCCVPAAAAVPLPLPGPGPPYVPQQQQTVQQPSAPHPGQQAAQQQPDQYPGQQAAQHPARHPVHAAQPAVQHPVQQPAEQQLQPRPQPDRQEGPKPHPAPELTAGQQQLHPQRPQAPPQHPAASHTIRPEVTASSTVDNRPHHSSSDPQTQQQHQQQETPRPQPPKFTIHLEPQTQRVPTRTPPPPARPASNPAPTASLPPQPTARPAESTGAGAPDLLPTTTTCGKVGTENRIINGKIASIGQFPWMALLGYRSRANVTFLCGGTLINERYVLTAAHCIRSQNRPVVVRLGEFNLTEPVDCDFNKVCAPPAEDIAIEDIISHPNFNIRNIKHDIALIRLSRSVAEYTDFVRPICLPVGLNVTDDKKFKIAGWGKTDFRDAGGSPVLQFTDVGGVGHEECNELQPPELQPLDPGQLCAGGDKGKDACKGDSGGPLMVTLVNDSEDPGLGGSTVTYQVGVVSYGPDSPCGTAPLPSIYTRVSTYVPWILDVLRP
ncbi:CLIP domain-containing serine protease 2 [Frankliniella fusca]|uniref:CLIP domain-containing serine protease 2 n=1 Tax=Frankliniella fusca TaxID=407009 RepID=A0AAE1I5V2_9NEOP|nr:CLIP domain-containing serine protease 2 [Frankliniella fusca]